MIYIFIAASYFPWLNVDYFSDDERLFAMRYVVWIMAIMGILYQQIFHEKYKMLETIFYVVMGIGPSVAILNVVSKLMICPDLFRLIQSYKIMIVISNIFYSNFYDILFLYSVTIIISRN